MTVFRCPTELCVVLIRTQLFEQADMPNVASIQDAVSVRPLSARAPGGLAPIAPVDVRAAADLRFFAGDHLARATGAFLGILGNAAEEYLGVGYQADADGRPFDGARRYTITFAPGGLPPVSAFWSITVYDADKHLYANEIDRYVIGSRLIARMNLDPGGGVTIDVQHEAPAPRRVANWLPCPPGRFGLTFRTYLPGEAIRSGRWTAPPVKPREQPSP